MTDPAMVTPSSASEAVHELLRQLVDERFVLTDRDGAITRWSRPAEQLFGRQASRAVGRPLAETLDLDAELPEHGGQLEATATRKDGAELELALTLVPVRMSESLEFNGFLEALEIVGPSGDALVQLGQSHRAVVDWIQAAIEGRAAIEEDELTAGVIVAFRPLVEPPPSEEPEPELEAEAVGAPEGAPTLADQLEQALQGTASEVMAARADAEAARGEASAATSRVAELGAQLAALREELADRREHGTELVAEHARDAREAVNEAEARAVRAETAAAAAAQAAEVARRSAEEAGAEVEALRAAAARGLGQAAGEPRQPLFAQRRQAGAVDRARRAGFDDAERPMATIGPDGRFRELNSAFSELVGYSEADFRSASWPPVVDRANLPKHREQLEQLLDGQIDSVDVNTGYLHAQGLLVPLAGRLSRVKEGGELDHLLLEIES